MGKRREGLRNIVTNTAFFWMIGVILAFLMVLLFGKGENSKITILAEHFLYEFDYKSIEYRMLLPMVFFTRIPLLIIILISNKITNGKKICDGINVLFGFSIGYVLFVLSIRYGIKGVLLSLILWSPHMFLYLFSLYNLCREYGTVIKQKILYSLMFIIGIIVEIYINPSLLSTITKLFYID